MAGRRWWMWLSRAAVRWFHNNVAVHKSIPFITALVFSQSLVEKGAIRFLVVHMALIWTKDVRFVASLNIVEDGLFEAMSLVMYAVSEKWTGPFPMVIISTVAYAVGMWLLHFSTKFHDHAALLFILAMLPIAIGFGGDPTLHEFINDQMIQLEEQNPQTQKKKEPNHGIDIEKEPNKCTGIKKEKEVEQDEGMMDDIEERAQNRMEFWARIGKILGSLAAFPWFGKPMRHGLYKILAIVITVSGFLFACGLPWYHRKERSGRASASALQVIRAAIRNCHLQYPLSPAQFYQNHENESVLWPRDSLFRCLRWVDKADIIRPTPTPQEQENKKLLFPVAEVKAVKLLLAMTPLWASLFISGLVKSAGSSFYYLQAEDMNCKVGSFRIHPTYFTVTHSFCSGTATLVVGPIIVKLWKRRSKTRPWKPNLGLALFCFLLSCIAAWLVETRRFNLMGNKKFVKGKNGLVVNISILWLTPQFWLLGFSQGFSCDGLKDFYYNQPVENRRQFLSWAFALGTFAGTVWITAYRDWFKQTIRDRHIETGSNKQLETAA